MAVNSRDWCNHLLVNLHCLYWFFLLTARQNVSRSQENTWLSVRRLENYQPFTSAFNFANTSCRLHTATDTYGSKYTIKFLLFSLGELTSYPHENVLSSQFFQSPSQSLAQEQMLALHTFKKIKRLSKFFKLSNTLI